MNIDKLTEVNWQDLTPIEYLTSNPKKQNEIFFTDQTTGEEFDNIILFQDQSKREKMSAIATEKKLHILIDSEYTGDYNLVSMVGEKIGCFSGIPFDSVTGENKIQVIDIETYIGDGKTTYFEYRNFFILNKVKKGYILSNREKKILQKRK